MKALLTLGGILIAVTGCRHAPMEATGTGASSFAFVERPTGPPQARTVTTDPVEQKPMEDYREARPVYPLINPVYPPRALKAKAGWATVGVRITVDPMGRVSDVAPSMLVFSTPGPFADDFGRRSRRRSSSGAFFRRRSRSSNSCRRRRCPTTGSSARRRSRRSWMWSLISPRRAGWRSGGERVGR